MVRKSHLDKGCLILSVFNGPNTTRTRGKDVVHYLIRFNDTLERFIFDYFNFESVDHLINYYSGRNASSFFSLNYANNNFFLY